MSENYKLIEDLAKEDARILVEKGKTYGDSWKKRGGVGAMMMLARKWDRIENITQSTGYDIFEAAAKNDGNILDDIQDLRCYLLLVEAHVRSELLGKGLDYGPAVPPAPAGVAPSAPATMVAPPTSAQQHGQRAQPNACPTCGARGNHAGFPCPRSLVNRGMGVAPECSDCKRPIYECICVASGPTRGYVDQD